MKHLLIAAACVATLACSSGSSRATILEPEVDLYQLTGPADLNYPSGAFEVQFGLRVGNRSSVPITLRRVQMSPVGSGGPYRVRPQTYFFNRVIGPDQFEDITFWARADATGDAYSIDATAPITVRAIAQFDSPSGALRKILMKTFSQQGTGPRKGN